MLDQVPFRGPVDLLAVVELRLRLDLLDDAADILGADDLTPGTPAEDGDELVDGLLLGLDGEALGVAATADGVDIEHHNLLHRIDDEVVVEFLLCVLPWLRLGVFLDHPSAE